MSLTPEQLAAIDATKEVDIFTTGDGKTVGTIIWVVVADGAVYVRSVQADEGLWYQRALANPSVSLDVTGDRIDFEAVLIEDDDTIARVTEALRAKYSPGGSLDRMTRQEVLAHTLRLDPVGQVTPANWPTLDAGARAALEQAVLAWRSGGLPCGASVVDADGVVVVVGRNHAYDEPTGTSPLEGTPLAHAELNALAQLPTDRDLTGDTLWSTQRPCSMCESAIRFCGVGATHYLAEDPSDIGPGEPSDMTEWSLLANAVFLQPFITRGLEETLDRNRAVEPETVRLAIGLAQGGMPQDLDGLLDSLPVDVTGLVEERDRRLKVPGS